MAKFPFVIGPKYTPIIEKVGSEEAGYVEIERRGFLSVGERAALQQTVQADDSSKKLLGLVRRCATKHRLDMESAYKFVTDIMRGIAEGPQAQKIEKEYGEEIDIIAAVLTANQAHQNLVKAYILLVFRVDDSLDFEDISELHPDILDALVKLYDEEDQKSIARLNKGVSDTDNGEEAPEQDTAENVELAEKKPAKKAKQA